MSVSSKLKAKGARIRRHVTSSTSKSSKSLRKTSSIALDPSTNPSLAAFELKKVITSKQLQNEQIAALTVSKNFIYLATKSGKISIFEERANTNTNNKRSSLSSNASTHVKHKKTQDYKKAKNIKQMAVNLDKNLMICVLANGHYIIMDALNLVEYTDKSTKKNKTIIPLNKTKNAERIISNFKPPYYRFAICSKKNIYIFEWSKQSKSYLFIREISNGEACISCLFFNAFVCYSTLKKGFVMHDIRSSKELKINVPSMPNNIPRMCQISHHDDDYKEFTKPHILNDGYLLVQASPILSIFIDKSGNPAQKDTVNWSSTPIFVIDCNQYMVGYASSTKQIEVISLVDQKAVQCLTVNVKQTDFDNDIRGLFRTSLQRVILYDEFEVFSLVPTPIGQQIKECIENLRIEKGLKLLMKSAPTQNELRLFHAQSGFALLGNLQWKRCMEHFEISDVDPRDIIYLFPSIKFSGFEYRIQHKSAPQNVSVHDIINKVIDYKRSLNVNLNASLSVKEERQNEYLHGIYYLAQFLWKRRNEPSFEDLKLIGAELKICVDTALLKIYVVLSDNDYVSVHNNLQQCAPFKIEQLLHKSEVNACVESECEKILISSQQYFNLALFYRSKKKLTKALNACYKIGASKEWHGQIEDAVHLSIDILSHLSDCADLWTYARWILVNHPEDAMIIFCDVSTRLDEDCVQYLSFDKVINYFREDIISDIESFDDIQMFDYIQSYLEFIVVNASDDNANCANAQYHDNLAYVYMKKIQKLTCLDEKYETLLNKTREKLLSFLSKSRYYSPAKLLNHAKKFQLYDEIIELNKKLKNHNAVLYTLVIDKGAYDEAIKYCIETEPSSKDRSDRFLELLRLYFGGGANDKSDENKQENEEKSVENKDENEDFDEQPKHLRNDTINIELLRQELDGKNDEFAFMNDDNSAMNFDFDLDEDENENGDENDDDERLESFMLRQKTRTRQGAVDEESEKRIFYEKGCEILYDYAFDMDYLAVLKLLPSSMDIVHFQKYIAKIVPYLVHKRRTMQIKKNLHKRLYLRQQSYLANTKSRVVRMDDASYCSKCGKSIGSSFFIFDPKTFKKYHHSCFYKKRAPQNENVITTTSEDTMMMNMANESMETPTNVPSYHDRLNNPFGNTDTNDTNPFGDIIKKKNDTNPFGNSDDIMKNTNPFGNVQSETSKNPFQTHLNDTNPFS